jgi:hypothetical protein
MNRSFFISFLLFLPFFPSCFPVFFSVSDSVYTRTRPFRRPTRVFASLDTQSNLKRDVLFCFDLELPPDFTPTPADGEVQSFALRDLVWVLSALLQVYICIYVYIYIYIYICRERERREGDRYRY